jgi:hypothetical protein
MNRSASLSLFWAVINALQVTVHLPMLGINMPGNVVLFYAYLIGIV